MPTADDEDPRPTPPAPQGPPLFVNPDELTAQQYAPPTFVGPDGAPVHPPQPAAPAQPGAPVFLKPGGAPVPSAAPGQVAPAGYTIAGGGVPGGPTFVTPEHGQETLTDDRPWPWWVGIVTLVVAFGAVMVLGIVLAIVFSAGGSDIDEAFKDNTHWLGLGQDVLWTGVVLLVPFLAVRYLKPDHLGLVKRPWGRSAGVLIICMVAFYMAAGGYSAAMGLDQDSNELLQDTGFGDSVYRDVLFALLFTVAAPVAEELLFRGVLFRSLRDGFMAKFGRGWSVALGALISGVIFGGIHVGGGQDAFLPVLMVLGVLLALAYQWSGTLYVPVVIHAINNAIATGFNSDPSEDWIYVIIALGPVLSVLTLMAITRFVRSVFPQERPDAPAPPPPPPSAPQFQASGGPANL